MSFNKYYLDKKWIQDGGQLNVLNQNISRIKQDMKEL